MEQIMKYSREYKKSDTIIDVKGVKIGQGYFMIAAGPCSVEDWETYYETAKLVKKSGANVIRGSVFKPRTSPYSFQGLGRNGLKLVKKLAEELDIVVETEVMDPRDVEITANHVDILRIGARNMQNFDLLKEVSKYPNPVILKRGISATIQEWLYAAEYLMQNGKENIILCERGIRSFDDQTRNVLDLIAIPVLRKLTHLPLIVDPSHATGRRDLITPASKAAVAIGADGLLIEVHREPDKAWSDAQQSISPAHFDQLMQEIRPYLENEHRIITR